MDSTPLRVLLVEDNPGDAGLVRWALAEMPAVEGGGQPPALTHVTRLADGLEQLRNAPFDILLLDLSLPDSSGLPTVERARAAAPRVPILVLTGVHDQELALAAVRAGAQDFLEKRELDGAHLTRALRYALEREQLRVELASERDRIQRYLDAVGVIVQHLDTDLRVTLINQRGAATVGYGEQELLGCDWVGRFVPERLRQETRQALAALVSGEGDGTLYRENPIVTRTGEERLIHWYNTVLRDEAGRCLGLLSTGEDVTERRRAERALRESEQKLRALIEQSGEGIILVDDQGAVVEWNAAVEAMLGIPTQHAMGRQVWDVLLDVFPAAARQAGRMERMRMAIVDKLTGQPTPLVDAMQEVHIQRPDGEMRAIQALLFRIQTGEANLLCCLLRDATERRVAEERERLFTRVLQLLNQGRGIDEMLGPILDEIRTVIGVDAVGVRLRQEDDYPYYQARGFDQEFIEAERSVVRRGADGHVLRDAEGQALLDCLCGAVLSGRNLSHLSQFTPAGTFWCNDLAAANAELDTLGWDLRNGCPLAGFVSSALVRLTSSGETVGLLQLVDRRPDRFRPELIAFLEELGAAIGIGLARRTAEQALRQGEQRYRDLWENSEEALYTHDAQGRITSVNRAFERLLGRPRVELMGTLIGYHLGPHALEWAEQDRHASDPVAEVHELEMTPSPGEHVVLELGVRPIWENERLLGYQGSLRDVTSRRRLERQLSQAAKMEAVGRLAAGVAHDFNNALTVINGYCQILLADMAEDDLNRETMLEIYQSGQRAAEITRQLLAFSRQQPAELRPLDLNQVMQGLVRMLGRVIGEDIALRLTPAAQLPPVRSDPGQIEQIVMNLAVNARDAMPGGGTLILETSVIRLDEERAARYLGAHPGTYVRLTVADTGHGMSPEVQSHLFEPFFTTKEVGRGTGLGLASVYGIVQQQGGFISVYSELGHGTAFHINLPALDRQTDGDDQPRDEAFLRGGQETILVVEDQPQVRQLGERILKRLGYRVLGASGAREALELCALQGGEIDLVLADVIMPEMSGPQLVARLQAQRPGLRVLFMSGYTGATIAEYGFADINDHLVQKPFTAAALANAIRAALDAPPAAT